MKCDCCSHCWINGKPRDRGPAVARWTHQIGNVSMLCRLCVDSWFDNADDDPELEPAAVEWLRRPVLVNA